MKQTLQLTFFLFTTSVFLFTACSNSLQTSTYTAVATNLAEYKTYAWVAPGDTALNTRRDDKIYAGLIQTSADKELGKKGMKIDNQNPDAVFMFDTKIEETEEYRQTQVNTGYGYGGMGYGGFGYGYAGPAYYVGSSVPVYQTEVSAVPVDEGTLSYSMYDRKTGKLLWRGVGTQKLDAGTNIERTIKNAASFIFAEMKVKHKK